METVLEMSDAVHEKFPQISTRADALHLMQFGEIEAEFAYMWFENLANALNEEMANGVPFNEHAALFNYLSALLEADKKAIGRCLDVAFAENLFWHVPSKQIEQYWHPLPANLKNLYLGFHGKPPI